ncbi:MAG TPA: DUF3613 domain-containing protein [Nevskiaceae bacterium]|nr:DUF3613 domain-containing protein [Nevskiaceae bacterium]
MRTSIYFLLPLLLPMAAAAQSFATHQSPAQAAASFAPPPPLPTPNAPADASGRLTQSWINLQESGSEAANDPQTLPGPIASEIYDRYLKSFTHPIPEHFTRQSFGVGGSGGGGGGS